MKSTIQQVANEVSEVLSNLEETEALRVSEELLKAKRIFVLGEGRSGLMGKAFAMRLMHADFNVYVVGETITPSIQSGDLLVAISGSGTTGQIVEFANKAKEVGAKVLAVTTNRKSPLAELSEVTLRVPAATKHRPPDEPDTIQPLGNQFDQSLHLLLDAIIIFTINKSKGNDFHQEMKNRHSNLE
ncbi:6-phospho-3-hexuloisomerase [Bacillus shivajii]|uniref:6-phospho-3-hexuloisomerase n=1 Tax=Bacillus shivajii TaxID=1983719 RepID=UPI001CFBFF14|nr:6-phospho-3-hexuloisomerase [Bacillus shivajii]UCZ53860.1 6-phospho-3-hexuloisomerase [Bacillus shivajii]